MRQVTLGRDGIDELFTVQKPGTSTPRFKIDKKEKTQNTYFSMTDDNTSQLVRVCVVTNNLRGKHDS